MSAKIHFSLARFFQALGDPTRLRLLNLIRDHEVCVCHLVEVLDCPQSRVSRHLAYLRAAGIVAARLEGKWMHYSLLTPPDQGAALILRQTLKTLAAEKPMQADQARLKRACCQSAPLVHLEASRKR